MAYADRLLGEGFNSRFQLLHLPYVSFRAEPNDGAAPSADGAAGDPDAAAEPGGNGDGQAGSGLTLDGLAVPFNSPTRINDWFDGEFDEQFAPGAFLRTIEEDQQVMLFDHGMHPMFGDIPIAEIQSLGEQKSGLRVQAEMFDNWMTEPLQGPIRSGLMRMSIMFRPRNQIIQEREGDVPLVTVTDVELRELGPVTFPAYKDTWIDLRSLHPSVRRYLESAQRGDAARPSGGVQTEPTRNRLARAKLHLLEMSK